MSTGTGKRRNSKRSARPEEVLDDLVVWGRKLGLERIRELLELLGRPQNDFPCVLVAGTNGKGSVAAMLTAALRSAGYRAGLFTSPHLESVRERIRVDGKPISEVDLLAALQMVLGVAGEDGGTMPTYFEALTSCALLHFSRAAVDVAILEVGLGGRLDATNTVEPILSVITSIAHDHEKQLGHRLIEIAREKAGILRAGRNALTWVRVGSDVEHALSSSAAECGARLENAAVSTSVRSGPASMESRGAASPVRLRSPRRQYQIDSPLAGAHQRNNLALAVRAAEHLEDLGFERLDESAIVSGIEGCRWPGRLEWVQWSGGPQVLLDAAHNLAGARALQRYLRQREIGRYDLILGAVRRPRLPELVRRLALPAGHVVLSTPASPRAVDPEELRTVLKAAGKEAMVVPDPALALSAALQADPEILLVSGSIYLLGAIRRELHRRFGVPRPALEISI